MRKIISILCILCVWELAVSIRIGGKEGVRSLQEGGGEGDPSAVEPLAARHESVSGGMSQSEPRPRKSMVRRVLGYIPRKVKRLVTGVREKWRRRQQEEPMQMMEETQKFERMIIAMDVAKTAEKYCGEGIISSEMRTLVLSNMCAKLFEGLEEHREKKFREVKTLSGMKREMLKGSVKYCNTAHGTSITMPKKFWPEKRSDSKRAYEAVETWMHDEDPSEALPADIVKWLGCNSMDVAYAAISKSHHLSRYISSFLSGMENIRGILVDLLESFEISPSQRAYLEQLKPILAAHVKQS